MGQGRAHQLATYVLSLSQGPSHRLTEHSPPGSPAATLRVENSASRLVEVLVLLISVPAD